MQLRKVFVFDIEFVFGECQKLGHIVISGMEWSGKIWTGLIKHRVIKRRVIKYGVIKHME